MNGDGQQLEQLIRVIKRICNENEILKILLQNSWEQEMRWQTILALESGPGLNRTCVPFAPTVPANAASSPAQFSATLAAITEALQQTLQQIEERVQNEEKNYSREELDAKQARCDLEDSEPKA